jgi:hypothetical protein
MDPSIPIVRREPYELKLPAASPATWPSYFPECPKCAGRYRIDWLIATWLLLNESH